MEVNEHFERLSLTYPYLGLGVQDDFCIQLDSELSSEAAPQTFDA